MTSSILICCGSGGVGKTTSSAALAVKLAHEGMRVVVLTIDPAKRLADSLNIGEVGGEPTRVPIPGAVGHCDAVMLDVTQTFVGLIQRFSPTPAQADRILSNRYFQFASTRLSGVHEYMAAEKVYELAVGDHYDVVVVDTPPSRNALDFLDAPKRLSDLMDGSVVRWLSVPAASRGWRALEFGGEVVSKVIHRVVGEQTAVEIAEFFDAFRDLWSGFQERSIAVQEMLRDSKTSFVLVTSPSPTSRDEALFFLAKLQAERMPFAGFVINRVQPKPDHIPNRDHFPIEGNREDWRETCDFVVEAVARQTRYAAIHQESIQSLREAGPKKAPIWQIPDQGDPVNDLQAIEALGVYLPGPQDLF